MKKDLLKVVKKDIKKGKESYPFMNLTLDDCYNLYDKHGITVEMNQMEISYFYTTQLQQMPMLGREVVE